MNDRSYGRKNDGKHVVAFVWVSPGHFALALTYNERRRDRAADGFKRSESEFDTNKTNLFLSISIHFRLLGKKHRQQG